VNIENNLGRWKRRERETKRDRGRSRETERDREAGQERDTEKDREAGQKRRGDERGSDLASSHIAIPSFSHERVLRPADETEERDGKRKQGSVPAELLHKPQSPR
jgi:hypothetical protein